MGTELIKNSQEMQLTPQNWQAKWSELAIKRDTPLSMILAERFPAISTINKGKSSTKNGVIVFGMFISSVCEYMSVEWSQYQMEECAQSAFDEYYHLSLPELKLFFVRLKTGYYTRKDMSRFAPIHLMTWLEDFNGEVLAARRIAQDKKEKLADEVLNPTTGKVENRQPLTDVQMGVLKKNLEDIALQMGRPLREIEEEDEYQRIRKEYIAQQMRKNPDNVKAKIRIEVVDNPEKNEHL